MNWSLNHLFNRFIRQHWFSQEWKKLYKWYTYPINLTTLMLHSVGRTEGLIPMPYSLQRVYPQTKLSHLAEPIRKETSSQLKVQFVTVTASSSNGYCSPNSKYWKDLFLSRPSSSDLTLTRVARLRTRNRIECNWPFTGSLIDRQPDQS